MIHSLLVLRDKETHPNNRARITLQFFIKVLPKIYRPDEKQHESVIISQQAPASQPFDLLR